MFTLLKSAPTLASLSNLFAGGMLLYSLLILTFGIIIFAILITFFYKVPRELKRIADALEQSNLIKANQHNQHNPYNAPNNVVYNQSMQATPTSNIQEINNDIVGPNSMYVPPKNKKNIFTTDLKDLFKK